MSTFISNSIVLQQLKMNSKKLCILHINVASAELYVYNTYTLFNAFGMHIVKIGVKGKTTDCIDVKRRTTAFASIVYR